VLSDERPNVRARLAGIDAGKPRAHARRLKPGLRSTGDDVIDPIAVHIARAAHGEAEQAPIFARTEEKLGPGLARIHIEAARTAAAGGVEGRSHREVAHAVGVDVADIGRYPAEIVARGFSGQRVKHAATELDARRAGYSAVRRVAPRTVGRRRVDRAVGSGVLRIQPVVARRGVVPRVRRRRTVMPSTSVRRAASD
jgi:hypothetical protein